MVVLTTNCHKNTLSKCDLPTNLYCQGGGVKSLVKKGLITERQSHKKKSQNQKSEKVTKSKIQKILKTKR